MNSKLSRALATLLIVLFSLSPAWATCGGGGGGGTGGVAGGPINEGPAPTSTPCRGTLGSEGCTAQRFDLVLVPTTTDEIK